MASTTKRTRKPKAAVTPAFSIVLKVNDQVLEGSGATALEALIALPQPAKIMGKGFLTITHGNLSKTECYYPVRLKRLFYNKLFKEIQAKNLIVGLKPIKL